MDRYDWQSDPEPDEPGELHVPKDVLPTQEDQPEELTEVERRLEKAHFYRMLLKHQLISSDSDEAIEVENEIQDFVRERLSVLLGIKPEPMLTMEANFTPEEVEALRAVAAKVLNRPNIVQAGAPKPPPTIKPLEDKPVSAVRPAQPVPETPRPAPSPVKRGRGRPRKTPAPAPTIAKSEPVPPKKKEKTAEQPGDKIRVVGAKRYKVVDRVVNDPATGKPRLDANGKPVTAEHLIDVTPKPEIPGRQPFPSPEVSNAMEAAKAVEVLNNNPIAVGLIPTAMSLPAKED